MPTSPYPVIELGTLGEYRLYIARRIGTPAALVAESHDAQRSRFCIPQLLGLALVRSNPALSEAYERALQQGYGDIVAA